MRAMKIRRFVVGANPHLDRKGYPLETMRMCIHVSGRAMVASPNDDEDLSVGFQALLGITLEPQADRFVFSAAEPRGHHVEVFVAMPEDVGDHETAMMGYTRDELGACLIEGIADYFKRYHNTDARRLLPKLQVRSPD